MFALLSKFVSSWSTSSSLHNHIRQSVYTLHIRLKFFFNKWIYNLYTLFCMFSWLLSTVPLHHNIRQRSVHPLHTRLKLFSIKWSYSMHPLLTDLPLKNN